jgi:hypothetical protein
MPRDLTDLMERATSGAPPEPHHASDITRIAARRQRRRTTFVAGAATLAVVAAAGGAFGLTRGHATTPEPAQGPYKYGQHQKLSGALHLGAASGFRTLTYDAPSMIPAHGSDAALPLYSSVDDRGRLLAVTVTGEGARRSVTYHVVDGPGAAPRTVRPPSIPTGGAQNSFTWSWTFNGDDTLLWRKDIPARDIGLDARVTDLDGRDAVSVQESFDDVPFHGKFGFASPRNISIDGGRAWYDVKTRLNDSLKHPVELVSLYSSDLASPGALRAEAPHDALEIDVSRGVAVWVDTSGEKVFTENLATGDAHEVTVPLGKGCRMPGKEAYFQETQQLVQTNGVLVAVNEVCGSDTNHVVVSDLAGHLVTEVDPGAGNSVAAVDLGERILTFAGTEPFRWYADDLVSGRLAELGAVGSDGIHSLWSSADRRTMSGSAGRFVLWYDKQGGHVGEFTD